MKKRRTKSDRQKLVAKLDKVFSLVVRRKDADNYGNVTCFTCGKRNHYRKMQAGHFQTRAKYSTRWKLINVQPQCPGCNMYNGGQQYAFGRKLDAVYGSGTADKVLQLSNQTQKFSNADLQYMIDEFEQQANTLEQRTG